MVRLSSTVLCSGYGEVTGIKLVSAPVAPIVKWGLQIVSNSKHESNIATYAIIKDKGAMTE